MAQPISPRRRPPASRKPFDPLSDEALASAVAHLTPQDNLEIPLPPGFDQFLESENQTQNRTLYVEWLRHLWRSDHGIPSPTFHALSIDLTVPMGLDAIAVRKGADPLLFRTAVASALRCAEEEYAFKDAGFARTFYELSKAKNQLMKGIEAMLAARAPILGFGLFSSSNRPIHEVFGQAIPEGVLQEIGDLSEKLSARLRLLPDTRRASKGRPGPAFFDTYVAEAALAIEQLCSLKIPRSRDSWFVETIKAGLLDSGILQCLLETGLTSRDDLEAALADTLGRKVYSALRRRAG